MSESVNIPVLNVRELTRAFGSLKAVQNLTIDFVPGEVHAVVGENGAGKSTLMNVLGGFLRPTSGTVSWGDKPFPIGSPKECRDLGIEMVHQHFMLVPEFSVSENIQLSLLGLRVPVTLEEVKTKAKDFGWDFPWDTKVKDLPIGIQQRIEILKAMAGDPKVVIFDEPTAVLSEGEVENLFLFVRRLASQGKIVIVIAHKIQEVLQIADRVTVLRRGIHIVTKERAMVEPQQLVEWMVGERVISETSFEAPTGKSLVQLLDVVVIGDRSQKSVDGVSFEVSAGSILGIGGVDGNGQLELSEVLAGVRDAQSGLVHSETSKIGFVPQDRRADGLALEMTISENMLVSGLRKFPKLINPKAVSEWANLLIGQYAIKAESANDKAKQLSGGNQQKVILARVLDQNPEIIVVVNPTRGLDVRAASFVHSQLRNAAKSGAAVILFSTDRDELHSVSNRQLWMSRGRLFQTEAEALV